MSQYVQFAKSFAGWVYVLSTHPDGIHDLDKEAFDKYIKPHAKHSYPQQTYIEQEVEVVGFGKFTAQIELTHNEDKQLQRAYFSIGDREGDALDVTERFQLPLAE